MPVVASVSLDLFSWFFLWAYVLWTYVDLYVLHVCAYEDLRLMLESSSLFHSRPWDPVSQSNLILLMPSLLWWLLSLLSKACITSGPPHLAYVTRVPLFLYDIICQRINSSCGTSNLTDVEKYCNSWHSFFSPLHTTECVPLRIMNFNHSIKIW